MHHPFHQCGVQVAGDHLRFQLRFPPVTRTLVRITSAWGREAKFLLQLSFNGDDCRRINAQWQLEMQSGRNDFEVLTEALHDRDRIARYGVISRPCEQSGQREDDNKDSTVQAAAWHHSPEVAQPLPQQVLDIGGVGSAAPRGVTVFRWHFEALLRLGVLDLTLDVLT